MTDTQVPKYDTAEAVDDALSAVKTRWDHGDAPYDPDVLGIIRAAEAMRARLYGSTATGRSADELLTDLEAASQIRERMGKLLDGVALALKGDPGPLATHGWHDLPEIAADTARRAAPAGAPKAWRDLFEGLALLARHPADEASPFNCTHDQLAVMADPSQFTDEEIARLAELGFTAADRGTTYGTFYSSRFGSA